MRERAGLADLGAAITDAAAGSNTVAAIDASATATRTTSREQGAKRHAVVDSLLSRAPPGSLIFDSIQVADGSSKEAFTSLSVHYM